MCTALSFLSGDHYFGRNLDYEFAYNQCVTVTPRHFPFAFREMGELREHYAMIGMAFVQQNTPLYYDATNEKGLSVAGLNFPGNAAYLPHRPGADNVASFEFIPYLLASCDSVAAVRKKLANMSLLAADFSEQLPASPLHWLIADRTECLVVEPVAEGLKVYDNPVGVLTNNPVFPYHMTRLNDFMALSPADPDNRFAPALPLARYSRGMGGLGLPGDLSSSSRFIKAAFTLANSRCGESEEESVSQFFHILASVAQQKGCCKVENGYEYTIYSSCCNTARGIYYYTTYENSQITAVDMHREALDGEDLAVYPLRSGQQIFFQN